MGAAERDLGTETVEGELAIVVDYLPGRTGAIELLQGTAGLVDAIDRLDRLLLSSIDTSLEPVSVVNDITHGSLKILLARVLRSIPDESIRTLERREWIGTLLVHGKHRLLQSVAADGPELGRALVDLAPHYGRAPRQLAGYRPPTVVAARAALDGVIEARRALGENRVLIQTELGDVPLLAPPLAEPIADELPAEEITNSGVELFKLKQPDYLGDAQWVVVRGGRAVRARVAHREWIARWRRREFELGPGDSLRARFEETIRYDRAGSEIDRELTLVEILDVHPAPRQRGFTESGFVR